MSSAFSSHCRQHVRRYDEDRYLISLFCPARARPAIWAVLAFNVEIARARESVSDPTLGLIRLQWWREALAEIYEEKPARDHPIVKALAHAIQSHDLPKTHFETLIDARTADMAETPFATLGDIEAYASATSAPLTRLSLHIMNKTEDTDVIEPLSKTYAFTGLLRAQAYHAAQGRTVIKPELVPDVLHRATDLNAVKPKTGFLKAMKAHTSLHLKQLRACNADPSDSVFYAPIPFKALRLWLGSL